MAETLFTFDGGTDGAAFNEFNQANAGLYDNDALHGGMAINLAVTETAVHLAPSTTWSQSIYWKQRATSVGSSAIRVFGFNSGGSWSSIIRAHNSGVFQTTTGSTLEESGPAFAVDTWYRIDGRWTGSVVQWRIYDLSGTVLYTFADVTPPNTPDRIQLGGGGGFSGTDSIFDTLRIDTTQKWFDNYGAAPTITDVRFDNIANAGNFATGSDYPELGSLSSSLWTQESDYSLSTDTSSEAFINTPDYTTQGLSARFYVMRTGTADSNNMNICDCRNTGDTAESTIRMRAWAGNDGDIQVRNADSSAWVSSTVTPNNEWVRIELQFDLANTLQQARVFTGSNVEGTTPDAEDTNIPMNLGGGSALKHVRFGNYAVVTSPIMSMKIRDVAWVEDLTWIGPADPLPSGSTTEKIRVGGTTPTKVYVGSVEATKVYNGSSLVWEV